MRPFVDHEQDSGVEDTLDDFSINARVESFDPILLYFGEEGVEHILGFVFVDVLLGADQSVRVGEHRGNDFGNGPHHEDQQVVNSTFL